MMRRNATRTVISKQPVRAWDRMERERWDGWPWAVVICVLFWLVPKAEAQEMRLEIVPVVNGKALRLDEVVPGLDVEAKTGVEALGGSDTAEEGTPQRFDGDGKRGEVRRDVRITRLDCLLSGLALRRKDGVWVESRDWFAYMSLAAGRMVAQGSGIPAGEYTGVRFRVGLDEGTNRADVAGIAPGHALNPLVNGLHWGWQGGYVFMALEGRWRNGVKEDGISYHVANAPQVMMVELPVEFQGGRPLTLTLELDVARVLAEVDFAKDGTATHSREGDALALKLKENVERAFRVRGLSYDVYQVPVFAEGAPRAPLPRGTHALTPAMTRRFPQVKLPGDNPLTEEGVALGRALFHDKRLSKNSAQACAGCHEVARAFAEGRRFSVGAEGHVGKRNAMPLFNLAWQQEAGFFWDGRARSLREQVLMPITDAHEMNESLPQVVAKLEADAKAEYAVAFERAFGSREITPGRMALALEQFLLTLVSQESRFDRAARKVAVLTESEKRGLQLFITEHDPKRGLRGGDCFHCHGGTLFTSQSYANNGLRLTEEDVGRMAVTGNAADRGKFKTPSLRNVALTGPYMHDGRFATLEEVVEHYSQGVCRTETLDANLAKHPAEGMLFTAEEKADLVAFLKTLTDEGFAGGVGR